MFTFFDQTWALSLSGPAGWARLAPDWDWGHPGRVCRQAWFSTHCETDSCSLAGSQYGGGVTEDFDDIWSLALGDTAGWVQLQPLGVPERALRRHGAAAAYDAARDRMVVVGGGRDLYIESLLVDAWALELGEPLRWVEIAPEGGNTPSRVRTKAHPDPERDRIILGQWGSLWSLNWTQPLPADIVLERADAGTSGVLVRWRVLGPTDFVAILERTSGGDRWKGVTSLRPDTSGWIRWSEPAPAPGSRVGFRLRVSGGGSSRLYGSTWLGSPARAALVLEGVRPNPGAGEFAVAFTLPEASVARLELFDLGGRCLHSEGWPASARARKSCPCGRDSGCGRGSTGCGSFRATTPRRRRSSSRGRSPSPGPCAAGRPRVSASCAAPGPPRFSDRRGRYS